MEICLNETQQAIAKEARRFLENECPMDYVRAMLEDERGFTDDMWAKMANMDWMRMRIPEPHEGAGMDQLDLNIILEEMGRALLPGPFFSTIELATEAIIAGGTDSQKGFYLPQIASGNRRGTLALFEADGGADPQHIRMKGWAKGEEFILNGTKLFVPDAHTADFLICAARMTGQKDNGEGITLFLVDLDKDGMAVSLMPCMDSTRKLCAVEFKGVRLGPDGIIGEPNKGWYVLSRVLQRAQVGLCAESLGGAQKVMEMATQFAKDRVQFGQPIGAFQVIKHYCAQMFVEVESARSILYWAAWVQDYGDPGEAAVAASAAKVYCSEVYRNVTMRALQIMGATGFCWEQDIHLYLKRAEANEVTLGDSIYHREKVVQLIGA